MYNIYNSTVRNQNSSNYTPTGQANPPKGSVSASDSNNDTPNLNNNSTRQSAKSRPPNLYKEASSSSFASDAAVAPPPASKQPYVPPAPLHRGSSQQASGPYVPTSASTPRKKAPPPSSQPYVSSSGVNKNERLYPNIDSVKRVQSTIPNPFDDRKPAAVNTPQKVNQEIPSEVIKGTRAISAGLRLNETQTNKLINKVWSQMKQGVSLKNALVFQSTFIRYQNQGFSTEASELIAGQSLNDNFDAFEAFFDDFSVNPANLSAFGSAFQFASTVQTKMNEGMNIETSQFFAEADSRGLGESETQHYIAHRTERASERRSAFYAEARNGGSSDEHARSYARARDDHNFTPETAHFYAQGRTQYNLDDSAAQRFAELPRVRERVEQRHAEQARAQQTPPQPNRASEPPPRANAAPAAAARPEPTLPDHIRKPSDALKYMGLTPETLTPESLRTRYRRLTLQMHPDKNPGDPNAQRKFTLLSDSYELLRRHLGIDT